MTSPLGPLADLALPLALALGLAAALLPALRRSSAVLPVAAAIAAAGTLACILASAPAGDDWTYAVAGRDGWLACQAAFYREWSGRYAATAMLSGWPQLLPLATAYPLVAMLAWLSAQAGLALLAWRLLPAWWSSGRRWTALAGLLLGAWAGSASLAEGGSWLAASLTYVVPAGAAAAGAALLLHRDGAGPRSGAIAILLALLAAGGSELVAGAQVGGLLVVLMLRRGTPGAGWRLAALAAAVAGAALSALAPGNELRQIAVLDGRSAPDAIATATAAVQAGWATLIAGLEPTWLLLGVILLLSAGARPPQPMPAWPAAALALAAVAAAALLQAPSLAASGWACPPRAANVVWLGTWGLLAAAAVWTGCWWASRRGEATAGAIGPIAVAGAALALLQPGPVAQALHDLPLLPAHHAAQAERRARLAAAPPGAALVIPMLDPVSTPRSCLPYDLTIDPRDWQNQAAARWHGLGALRTAPPGRAP